MSLREDFWARRKRQVAEEEAEVLRAEEAAALAEEHAALEEKPDEEVLEELGLPAPESLTQGDDFSAFMAKAVPDRIRRRALRVLWRSNPTLANLDGLLDYGEDFTDSAKVIENLQTAYQVGKGMLAHVEELARQAQLDREEGEAIGAEPAPVEAEDAGPAEEEALALASEPVPDLTAEPEAAEAGAEGPEPQPQTAFVDEDDDWAPPPRRRMQFSFDGERP